MHSYSTRRPVSYRPEDSQPIEPQPIPCLPNNYYRRQYDNGTRNRTPNKERRILFANKQNNSINIQYENEQTCKTKRRDSGFQKQGYSPLKKSLYGINQMSIVQRSTRKPLGYAKNSLNQEKYDANPDYTTPRNNQEEGQLTYRNSSARKSYRQRDSIQNYESCRNGQRGFKEQRTKIGNREDQRNYSYLFEKEKQVQQSKNNFEDKSDRCLTGRALKGEKYGNSQRKTSKAQQICLNQIQKNEQKSPLRTPRKNYTNLSIISNPYIEKTQILRQKMQRIGKMTPKGSIYKNVPKQTEMSDSDLKSSVYKQYSNDCSMQQSSIQNSQVQPTRSQFNYQSKQCIQDQKYRSSCSYAESYREKNPGIEIGSLTHQFEGISNLSKKINQRLKAIINKHQN